MQYRLCAAILAAATLDVALAHPSAHQGHKHLHARNAEAEADANPKPQNWDDPAMYTGVDFNTVNYGGPSKPTPAPQPNYGAPAGKQPAKKQGGGAKYQAPKQNGGGGGGGGGDDKGGDKGGDTSNGSTGGKCAPGNGGWGSCPAQGTGTTPTGSGYETKGNTGMAPGSPNCGCNIQPLCEGASSSGYDYTNTFKSTASSPRKITIWNTVGCQSGSPLSGKTPSEGGATTFTLSPGKSQTVAIQKGSKINWCDYTDGGVNADDGSRKCVYGEAELGFKDGWSAYDVSLLRNDHGKCGMSIQAPGSKVSSCSENCYNPGEEKVTNIAPVLGPGPVHLTTEIMDPK